jgi:hypothetical protein
VRFLLTYVTFGRKPFALTGLFHFPTKFFVLEIRETKGTGKKITSDSIVFLVFLPSLVSPYRHINTESML